MMMIGFFLALLTGSLVGLQNLFNSQVNERVGSWATTALVLGMGFLASLTFGLLFEGSSLFDVPNLQPWHWFSGMLGVGVVVCLVQGIRRLGPTFATAIVMTSQLGFAFLWDAAFTVEKMLGVLVIIGGIFVFKMEGSV